MRARITKDNWIVCGKCGHKLAKVVMTGNDPSTIAIEFKCHSCKSINVLGGDPNKEG